MAGSAPGKLFPCHRRERVRESFRFILAHPGVLSIVVGTINPANLRENCAVVREMLGAP